MRKVYRKAMSFILPLPSIPVINTSIILFLLICLIIFPLWLFLGCGQGSSTDETTTTTTTTDSSSSTTTTSSTSSTTSTTTTTTTTTSTTTGTLKWAYVTQQIYYSSPAIGDDGTIYIGSAHIINSAATNYLYALNNDGTLKWRYETGANMHIKGAPAIGSDGTVYCIVYDVTGQTSHLYALNSGGTLKWKYEDLSLTDPGGFGEWTAAISPEATQDVIFAPSRGGGLYAINSADGSLRWRYAYGGYITTPVIGLSNTIYFNADGGPSAINPDGTLKWRYISTGYGYSPPSLGSQETVYFGLGGDQADTAYVYALNSSGSLEWKCSTAGLTVFASPAVGSDGTIYIGTTAKGSSAVAGQCGVFYAIDASGVKKWSYDTSSDHTVLNPNAQSDIYSSATIGADGTIYFSTEGRYLYALNPDGTVKIKYDMYALSPISSGGSAIVYSSPAIAADGTIYVGDYYHFLDTTSNTAEGAVYALRSDSLGIDNTAIWPKFHGNNKNTGKKD